MWNLSREHKLFCQYITTFLDVDVLKEEKLKLEGYSITTCPFVDMKKAKDLLYDEQDGKKKLADPVICMRFKFENDSKKVTEEYLKGVILGMEFFNMGYDVGLDDFVKDVNVLLISGRYRYLIVFKYDLKHKAYRKYRRYKRKQRIKEVLSIFPEMWYEFKRVVIDNK